MCEGKKRLIFFFCVWYGSAFSLQKGWVVISLPFYSSLQHDRSVTDPWFYTLLWCWIRWHCQLVWMLIWRSFSSWSNSKITILWIVVGFETTVDCICTCPCLNFMSCCVNDFVTFGYFFLWLAVTLICYVAFKVWKCWSSYSMCLSDYGIPFSFIGIQAFSYVKHCWLWSVLPGNSQDRMPDFFIIVEIIVHAIEPMKPRNWLSRTRSSE